MFNDLWATFSQQFPDNFASLLTVSTVETIYMSVLSTLIAALLGLPLGFLTFLTNKGAILENKKLNAFLNVIINIGRSIPYIILLLALIPLTSWLLPGGSIGSNAAIVSLSAAATPFFARLTSNALFEIPTGLTETAKAMGATNWQIIRKFYLPESLPTLINAITLTFVTLIGYTAMAGTQGGGGLGSLAINYGVYRNMPSVTWAATIVIVIIVMLKNLFAITAIASALVLTGCKEEKKADAASTAPAPTSIKVGVMAGPEHQVAETAAKVAKDKYNLNVEFVLFNDYALPNTAVSKGDLDANAMQHKPYLDEDVKAKNLNNLVIVGNTFVYPLAGYSKTIKNVNELKDGAKVVVPNDPSNRGRALILLEKQGLIKLKNSNDLLSTVADIVENPKNLKISEVDTSVAARALDDVDLAVVNNTYAGQVGLNAQDNGVFVEDKDSPYVNIIVARTDNKDSKAIQDFVKAYQTEEVYQEAKKHFKDGVVKGW